MRQISKYVFKMMKVFGVYDDGDMPTVTEGQAVNQEDIITPFMNVLQAFRDQIKEKAGEGPKALF